MGFYTLWFKRVWKNQQSFLVNLSRICICSTHAKCTHYYFLIEFYSAHHIIERYHIMVRRDILQCHVRDGDNFLYCLVISRNVSRKSQITILKIFTGHRIWRAMIKGVNLCVNQRGGHFEQVLYGIFTLCFPDIQSCWVYSSFYNFPDIFNFALCFLKMIMIYRGRQS